MCAKIKKVESEDEDENALEYFDSWNPKTELGRQVKSGEITSIHEVFKLPSPIKEVNIVDILLPDLGEEVVEVKRVQRVTDSGRRMRYRVVAAVGNRNGYIGIGQAKGKGAGPTIRKAIRKAKLNIKEIKRGCGSWECGCAEPHSVPFKVEGKWGSVKVEILPAPRGTGQVSGEIGRKVLSLAGVNDAWVHTEGYTRTNINFAYAVVDALNKTNTIKAKEGDIKNLGVKTGMI
ncbi:MAG: 30S ribosomal protein S5 [Candidatus Altiarchaeales archaeon ex4484_96]|nr:MAG: 30S ribosomal protein S5 [Candidatus Altiarchaeales archaeon ex4484_96]